MSSPAVQNVVVEPTEKVVRPRKPTLAAKHQKFLVFGYDILNKLSEQGLLSGDVKLAQDAVKMYSSVDDQVEFYQKFLDDFKPLQKEMKKLIVAHNKPPKAPRKPRAPKPVVDGEEPKKVGRKKNAVKVVNDAKPDDIIAQLVSIGTDGAAPAEPKVPAKRGRKPKAKDTIPEPVSEPAPASDAKPVADKKPRKNAKAAEPAAAEPASPKKKPAKKAEKKPDPEPQDDDELVTREYVLNGQQILVDDQNNVYHFTTHEHIGSFDPNNNSIIPL